MRLWLLDEMPEGNHETIDLRDFNKWVKRTRGFPHDRKTVKSAAAQLREKGVLTNAKSYTPYVLTINFTKLYNVFQFTRTLSYPQEVLEAINYFLNNRDGVRKPEGWFRVCLENNWVEKEKERHQLLFGWSTEGLFEAIRYCNELLGWSFHPNAWA